MTERFAIDRDPALEALLYEPDRNAPLPDNFYRAAIAGGSIVPPISGARARYEDSRLGIIAIVIGLCLVAAAIAGFHLEVDMHPTIEGYVNAWKEMYGRAGEQDRLNEIALRHGRTSALGRVQDAITACLDEKERLNKCSHGYREACFDLTHRILVMLREEQSK